MGVACADVTRQAAGGARKLVFSVCLSIGIYTRYLEMFNRIPPPKKKNVEKCYAIIINTELPQIKQFIEKCCSCYTQQWF